MQGAPHRMLLQSCDVELWGRIMAAASAPTVRISSRSTLLRVFQVPLRMHLPLLPDELQSPTAMQ